MLSLFLVKQKIKLCVGKEGMGEVQECGEF